MSEARINRISNELGTGGPIVSGITTFSNVNYFVPPRGTTAERPSNCPPGSIRFNTDGAHLEYFDGLQWLEMEAFNNELGVNGALGNRGVFTLGNAPGVVNTIEYITISTLGNSVDFGDTITSSFANACANAMSSSTRGIFSNGTSGAPASTNVKEYVTISSTGNSIDFGDSTIKTEGYGACSSSTRGIGAGGFDRAAAFAYTNVIDYVTISQTGNAVDFGDLITANGFCYSFSSSVRGIWVGGYNPSPTINVIQYVTISTLGNATDFGDLTLSRGGGAGCSNSTRGIAAGGGPSATNTIDFITIASTGNAQDFGDLTTVSRGITAGVSSPTRGVFVGGGNSPAIRNIMDYITISTQGNAVDFGDTSSACSGGQGFSNGHGGL
jgi:hypothetical protein